MTPDSKPDYEAVREESTRFCQFRRIARAVHALLSRRVNEWNLRAKCAGGGDYVADRRWKMRICGGCAWVDAHASRATPSRYTIAVVELAFRLRSIVLSAGTRAGKPAPRTCDRGARDAIALWKYDCPAHRKIAVRSSRSDGGVSCWMRDAG